MLADFLSAVASCAPQDLERVVLEHSHEDAVWEVVHPFNTLTGARQACEGFWGPLKASFPGFEVRQHFAVAGEYLGEEWVSTFAHVMGSFEVPWVGIPASHRLSFLRFGLNALVVDGKIARAHLHLDLVDVMRQAGYYPFREMPGSAEQWPGPPASSGADLYGYDPELGLATLTVTRERQVSLPPPASSLDEHRAQIQHSPHWHPHMNWYGPAGVGSCRGMDQFRAYHVRLFLQAFPDRSGGDTPWPASTPGHYIRAGDGRFSVTAGWPSLQGTHTGAGWLGMAPTGRKVGMRVVDWYRADEEGLLIDNWVMIDVLHILDQLGYDVLEDMRQLVARASL
jgi:predicted ester cyclase